MTLVRDEVSKSKLMNLLAEGVLLIGPGTTEVTEEYQISNSIQSKKQREVSVGPIRESSLHRQNQNFHGFPCVLEEW